MEYETDELKAIFKKTNGVCRICRGTEGPKLEFENYGKTGEASGWIIEQMKEGAPDERWPVHITCGNRKITGRKPRRRSKQIPAIPLVPEQDMEIERWQAQLRGNAWL